MSTGGIKKQKKVTKTTLVTEVAKVIKEQTESKQVEDPKFTFSIII